MTRALLAAALSCAHALGSIACAGSTQNGPPPLPSTPVAFRVELTDGRGITLGSLRGRPVLVTVMTTWAGPALIEVPRLKALAEETKGDLTILCIALDDELEAIRIFKKTFELPYLVGTVEDRARFTGEEGPFGPIRIVPTSVLVDAEGRVVARADGTWPPKVLEAAVSRILARSKADQ